MAAKQKRLLEPGSLLPGNRRGESVRRGEQFLVHAMLSGEYVARR